MPDIPGKISAGLFTSLQATGTKLTPKTLSELFIAMESSGSRLHELDIHGCLLGGARLDLFMPGVGAIKSLDASEGGNVGDTRRAGSKSPTDGSSKVIDSGGGGAVATATSRSAIDVPTPLASASAAAAAVAAREPETSPGVSFYPLTRFNGAACDWTGEIPAKLFGGLTNNTLTDLDLSNNGLSGQIPIAVGACTHLVRLSLYSNALSGIIPKAIFINSSGECRLPRLKSLSLGRNWLEGSIPDELCQCTSLRSVSLQMNSLTGFIPDAVLALRDLVYLNVSDNNLTGILPVTFGNFLARPITLNIARNSLSGVVPRALLELLKDDAASVDYSQNMLTSK